MAKKTHKKTKAKRPGATKRPAKACVPAAGATLDNLRGQIDDIDRELVSLIARRAAVAREIGQLKNSEGQSIYAPQREERILARVQKLNRGALPDHCIRAVFRELISASRAVEKTLKVAYLGPEYSYSHLAALDRFGHGVELVPVGSIAAVFEEVDRGTTDFGMVPLENSTDGRIADTLDMFTRTSNRICGEVQLWIHHNLLGRCARAEVNEVYSKPQALSQCRNWLAKHLTMARTVEVTSTTTAAQLAREKPGAAAIASRQAGVHYGLDVLAANIEDNRANLTRFAVIAEESAERTGNDKTAVMFQVPHRPGALADAMAIFKRNTLNLTWIESFPIAGQQGGYFFFAEMIGHESDRGVSRALAALKGKSLALRVLGSYPVGTPVG